MGAACCAVVRSRMRDVRYCLWPVVWWSGLCAPSLGGLSCDSSSGLRCSWAVGGREFGALKLPLVTTEVRRDSTNISLAAFLGGLGADDFRPFSETRPSRHAYEIGTSLDLALRTGNPPCPFGGLTFPTASPLHSNNVVWCRTIQPACHRLRL
jgi:hypothetical protein